MSAYYNELDPFAAQWLRNLIAAKLIAPGEVDERSIVDVRADDLKGFVQCHFFAGIGGWSYALRLAGWPDDRPVWSGSCPCQPFSQAGKRQGFADDRHLWPVWFDLIRNARPGIVFGEQVASATEWLGLVRSDLGSVDYVVGARPFEAASAGAYHLRNRIGFVAHDAASRERRRGIQRSRESIGAAQKWPSGQLAGSGPNGDVVDAIGKRGCCGHSEWKNAEDAHSSGQRSLEWVVGADGKTRPVKSGIRLLVNGFPNRVGLLRGFGNAIDPRSFAQFISAVMECIP